MANQEQIIALKQFIESSAFATMPKHIQDEMQGQLKALLEADIALIKQKIKDALLHSATSAVTDNDIEFAYIVKRNADKVITIEEYNPISIVSTSTDQHDLLGGELHEETTDEDKRRITRKKSEAFAVTIPDGNVIMEKNAVRTFIKTLQTIGFEKIAKDASSVKLSSWPVVSTHRRPKAKESWQELVDGWYVYTHASNFDKIKSLLDIARLFSLDISIKNEDTGEVLTKENELIRPRSNNRKTESSRASFTSNHDKSKFSLNGADFTNKRRFAWQVVKTYVEKNPSATCEQLQSVFRPEFTSKKLGVVRSIMNMPKDMPESEYPVRFLMKDDELIELADGDIVTVCSQWNPERLAKMIDVAVQQGWSVRRSIDGVVIDEEEMEPYDTIVGETTTLISESVHKDIDGSYVGVTLADGAYIEEDTSFDTFIATLKKIGLSRIPDVGVTFGNINLVSVMEKDAAKQIAIDGVYVYKDLTVEEMMDALQRIADYYYMNLEIGTEEE